MLTNTITTKTSIIQIITASTNPTDENNNMTTNAAGDNWKGTNAANNTTNNNGIHYM